MYLLLVFVFITADFITGLVKALKEKNFSSTVMREGLFHKTGSLLLMLFAYGLTYACNYLDLGIVGNVPVVESIAVYIILMECGSIIENIAKINPQILPNEITKYFDKLNKKGE